MKKLLLLLAICGTCIFANTLQNIQQSKNIRIGVRLNLPPFSEQNQQNGAFEGFEIRLAQAIGKSIVGPNGTITLVGLNAKDRIPMLQNNEIDLAIANFSKTAERAKVVDFSMPYLSNYHSVLTKKSDNIKNINDLTGKKLLYIKGTTTEEFIREATFPIQPIQCQNTLDCFEKLRNGDGDGYMHTNILIAQLTLLDDNILMPIKNIGNLQYICVGIAKDNRELLEAINKEILNLSKGDFFQNAYNDTFDPFFKGTVDRKYLLLDDLYRMLQQ